MSTPRAIPWRQALPVLMGFATRQYAWSRRTVFLVLILLVPAGLATVIRATAVPGTITAFRQDALAPIVFYTVQVVSLFTVAGYLRDAMEDRTLTYLLTRPIGRARVTLGLFLGLMAALIPLVLASAAAGLWCCDAGIRTGVPGLGGLLVATTAAAVLYGCVHYLLGLVVRNPTVTGIIVLLVVDVTLPWLAGAPYRLAFVSWLDAIVAPAGFVPRITQVEGTAEAMEAGTGWTLLTTVSLVCVGLTLGIARGKDFIGYEKPA